MLIHPLTESSYDDHSKNALWIGTSAGAQVINHGSPSIPSDKTRWTRVEKAAPRRGARAAR